MFDAKKILVPKFAHRPRIARTWIGAIMAFEPAAMFMKIPEIEEADRSLETVTPGLHKREPRRCI